MTPARRFILDADVFITAKNAYYAFDICPGYWAALIRQHRQGVVFSITRVRDEIRMGQRTDKLVQWVSHDLPADFFLDVDEQAVVDAYAAIALWVQRNTQFTDGAKAKFASGADGWLVAHAMTHGDVVVTNEQPAPLSRTSIKIPDICTTFSVSYVNTFEFLRMIGVQLKDAGDES